MSEQQHELKCWPEYFGAVLCGAKRFEVRENDRGFDVGHLVWLREWEPGTSAYTGRSATFRIGYLTSWGQKPGTVVFSLEPVAPSPALAGAQATGAQDACTVCWATAGLVRVTQHRCEKHLLLDDDDRRAAFMAGRFGRELPSGWVFHEPEWAHNADEAYAAYLVWLAQRPEAQR
jgi:hypothetical protein